MRGRTQNRDLVRTAVLRLWARLFAYALSLTRNRERASDVLQQTALQALASKHPPEDKNAIDAWLFKIARNVWVDTCRRERVRERDVSAEPVPQIWSYDDRLIAAMTVSQGLTRLDTAHREIIELVDIHGFKYAEAANILGVPEGTVMSRLSRARFALLEAVGGNVVALEEARRRRT